jgi:hypothetical protein
MNAFTGYGELPELRTEALHPVGAAYERNTRRVYALVLFAPAAVWMAMTVQRHTDDIEHRYPKKDPRTRISLISAAIKKKAEHHAHIIERGGPDRDALLDQQHKVSFHVIGSQSDAYSDGPEAWMASQIIATWTAFESMAQDLWEAALNTKPKILARLGGRNQSKAKSGDDPKRIRLDWLYQHDFNLADHMGKIF